MKKETLEAVNLIRSKEEEKEDNVGRLRTLISEGLDVNDPVIFREATSQKIDWEGSLLQLAIVHDKSMMVKVLLESKKINLQFVNREGEDALHVVVAYRSDKQQATESQAMAKEKEIAETIINYSNHIDKKDINGNTALHKAVINGNIYVVELLLKKDYLFRHQKLLSIKNIHGNTVLHEVVQNGKQGKQILSLLMRVTSQQDLEEKNVLNETPIETIDRLIGERSVLESRFPGLLSLLKRLYRVACSLRIKNQQNFILVDSTASQILFHLTGELTHLVHFSKNILKDYCQVIRDTADLVHTLTTREQALTLDVFLKIEFCLHKVEREIYQFQQSNPVYIKDLKEAKKILQQRDYLIWKEEIANLPSSFPDYQKSLLNPNLVQDLTDGPNIWVQEAIRHYRGGVHEFYGRNYIAAIEWLTKAIEYYDMEPYIVGPIQLADTYYLLGICYKKQAEASPTVQLRKDNFLNAQTHLESSLDTYLKLQNYPQFEKVYREIAEIQIKQSNSDYEKKQLDILVNERSSNKDKLRAHFALASFYDELNNHRYADSLLSNPELEQSLIAYEAYHYSLAYEFTQGEIDTEARLVLQREMGIGHNIKLGTTNIQQCVAVFAFEPIEKKLVLAHFDKFSGPLTFIEELLNQFPADAKLDIYLSGGRDRSEMGRPISDNNINQVLKQLYVHKDRISILSSNLGDKPSPPAVIFDPKEKRLVQGVAKYPDRSLDTRAARMNLNLNKLGNIDYLYPLTKINYEAAGPIGSNTFSAEEKQQLAESFLRFYSQSYAAQVQTYKAWSYNQIFYPSLRVLNTIGDDFNKPLLSSYGPIANNIQPFSQVENFQLFFSSQERFGSNLDLVSIMSDQSDNAMPISSKGHKRLSNSLGNLSGRNKKFRSSPWIDELSEENDYQYPLLSQEDIADIGYSAYGAYRTSSESRFAVGSQINLEKQLQAFKSSLSNDRNINIRWTFILSLDNTHWVTLVLSCQQNIWQAFYVDSKRPELDPPSETINNVLRRALEINKLYNLSDARQVDGGFSGLWALETAGLINQLINNNPNWQGENWKVELDKKGLNQAFFKDQREHYTSLLQGHLLRNIRIIRNSGSPPLSLLFQPCVKRKKRHTIGCVAAGDLEKSRKRLQLLKQAEDWVDELTRLGHIQMDWFPILTSSKLVKTGEEVTFYHTRTQKQKVIRFAQQKTLTFREALRPVYDQLRGLFKFAIHDPEQALRLILNIKNGRLLYDEKLPAFLNESETADGLNAAFTIQTLIAFFQQKHRQTFSNNQNPLALTLEIHTYVNLVQMGHGVLMDSVKIGSLVKTLLIHKRIIPKLISPVHLSAKTVVTQGVGIVLSVLNVGLDIDELTQAKTEEEKNIFATQLTFDIGGLILSASGMTAAFLGTIVAGLGVGATGLVQAYSGVVNKVHAVGEFLSRVDRAYHYSGYEKIMNANQCQMKSYWGAVITEINFQKAIIQYGSQFIYRTNPLSRGVFGSGKKNFISWPGDMPRPVTDKRQALNVRELLEYADQAQLGSWHDCFLWELPSTPIAYWLYDYSALPGATTRNDLGLSVGRRLEHKGNLFFDGYVFPSEYIMRKIIEERVTTPVTIRLDQQARVFVIPSFSNQHLEISGFLHYTFIASHISQGGQCHIYLNTVGSVQLKEGSLVNYTWILNAETLSNDVLGFTAKGITVGNIPIYIPQSQSSYYFIDKKGTTTFQLDFTQARLIAMHVNYQKIQEQSSSLQTYLRSHYLLQTANTTLPALITCSHFPLQDEYGRNYIGKAYYAVASDRYLYTKGLPKNLSDAANLIDFTTDSAYFFEPTSHFFWRTDTQHRITENYVFLSEFINATYNSSLIGGAVVPITAENDDTIRVAQTFTNSAKDTQRRVMYHIVDNKLLLSSLNDDKLIVNLYIVSLFINNFNLTTEERLRHRNALQELCINDIFNVRLAKDKHSRFSGRAVFAELSSAVRISPLNQTLQLPTLWIRQTTSSCQLIIPQIQESVIYLGSLRTPEEKEVFYFLTPRDQKNLGQLYRQEDGDYRAMRLNSVSNLISAFFDDQNTLLVFTNEGIIKKIDALGKAYTLAFTREWTNNQTEWGKAALDYLKQTPPGRAHIPLFGIFQTSGNALAVWIDTHDQSFVLANPPLQQDGKQFQLIYLGKLGNQNFFHNENKTVYYQKAEAPLLSTLFHGTQFIQSLAFLNALAIAENAFLYQQKLWLKTQQGLLFSLFPQKLEEWFLEKIYFPWMDKANCIKQYDSLKIPLLSVVKNEAEYFRYCFNSAFSKINESFLKASFHFSNSSLISIEKNTDTITHWWNPAQDQFLTVPLQKNARDWSYLAKTTNQDYYFFSPKEKMLYILPADVTMDTKKTHLALSTELALRLQHKLLWSIHTSSPQEISIPLFEDVEVLEMNLSHGSKFTFNINEKAFEHYRNIIFSQANLSVEKNLSRAHGFKLLLDSTKDKANSWAVLKTKQTVVISHTKYQGQLNLVDAMDWPLSVLREISLQFSSNGNDKIEINFLGIKRRLNLVSEGTIVPLEPNGTKNSLQYSERKSNYFTVANAQEKQTYVAYKLSSLKQASVQVVVHQTKVEESSEGVWARMPLIIGWGVGGVVSLGIGLGGYLMVRYLGGRQLTRLELAAVSLTLMPTSLSRAESLITHNKEEVKALITCDKFFFEEYQCAKTQLSFGTLGACVNQEKELSWFFKNEKEFSYIVSSSYDYERNNSLNEIFFEESNIYWFNSVQCHQAINLEAVKAGSLLETLRRYFMLNFLLKKAIQQELIKRNQVHRYDQALEQFFQRAKLIGSSFLADQCLFLSSFGDIFQTVGLKPHWHQLDPTYWIKRVIYSLTSPLLSKWTFIGLGLETGLLHPYIQKWLPGDDKFRSKLVVRFTADLLQFGFSASICIPALIGFLSYPYPWSHKLIIGLQAALTLLETIHDPSARYLAIGLFILPQIPYWLESIGVPVTRSISYALASLEKFLIPYSLWLSIKPDPQRIQAKKIILEASDRRVRQGKEFVSKVVCSMGLFPSRNNNTETEESINLRHQIVKR